MTTTEYRCVLFRPHSDHALTLLDEGRFRLPRISIPTTMRPARGLQEAIRTIWGLNVFILDIWAATFGSEPVALAELLTTQLASIFKEVSLSQLSQLDLSEEECNRIELLVEGQTNHPSVRCGWIDVAIAWIESLTGRAFFSAKTVEQWNAGGGFVLFRVRSGDGQHYWFKATSEPNAHEFRITCFLCDLCPEFLPRLIATRKEWNAWLTEDAGNHLSEKPTPSELASVAGRLARLQLLTIGKAEELLAAGALDQCVFALRNSIDAVIVYLIEAMARQTSTKAAPLCRDRLLEVGEILRDACFHLEALKIPDTLNHNDLNPGNILCNGADSVFTDWSEAAVGNPFLSCERLSHLSPNNQGEVRSVYRNWWAPLLGAESVEQAFVLAQPLTIYAYLYGRGDWLRKGTTSPQFDSYARSLARHIDRAAQSSQLRALLCH